MKKMNVTNNQAAFEYVIYMIGSSYFRSATCKANEKAGNLKIYYKETKSDTQYLMEETVIKYMDALERKLTKEFFDDDVQVFFKPMADGTTRVCFQGEKSALFLNGAYTGKKTDIYCVVGTK